MIRLIEYLIIYNTSGLSKNHITTESICDVYMLSLLWLIWCWFTGYKRIFHFMAVDSATNSLSALSIWRNSLLLMFIFVNYSAWNIPFEHLHLCIPRCDQTLICKHLCIPRCDQTLIYKHLCIPRCIHLFIYHLSKGCPNLSVTACLVIVSIYLSMHLYILIWYCININNQTCGQLPPKLYIFVSLYPYEIRIYRNSI